MLKSFIRHIQDTTRPQIVEVDGATFAVASDGAALEIRPEIDHPTPLELHSLDALVQLVESEAIRADQPLYITIPDPLTVRCFGQPQPAARQFRQTWYTAFATDVPGWSEKVQLGFEEA